MPFPYVFPFKFDEFIKRFVEFGNVDDTLKFYGMDDSLMCNNVEDSLKLTTITDTVLFDDKEDAIKFTEVRI